MAQVPVPLRESPTVFIPKKSGAVEPKDFRPITISSCFVRLFHKILASRLQRLLPYSQRQKRFMPVEGCLKKALILLAVLAHAKSNLNRCVVYLEIAKAYDSGNHPSLVRAMRAAGTPVHLCR